MYPPSVKVAAELVQTEAAMQQAMAAIAYIGNNSAMHRVGPMSSAGLIGPRNQVVLLTLFVCLCM